MATFRPPSARMSQIIANAQRLKYAPAPVEEAPVEAAVPAEVVAEEAPVVEPVVEEAPAEEPVVEAAPSEEPEVVVEPVAEEVSAEDPDAETPAVEYDAKMKKVELLELAASLGLEIPDSATKAEILEALDEATKPAQ